MSRWTGVITVPLSDGGAICKVAASLLLSPSKSLAVPAANAVLFTGDRVRGSGNPVVERLSESVNIVAVLARKLAGVEANAWIIDAPEFFGPFAVYREFVPTVDASGNPRQGYDPAGFRAATAVVRLLSRCVDQLLGDPSKGLTPSANLPSASSLDAAPPKTIIMGFSKGGIVVNQLITELAQWASKNARDSPRRPLETLQGSVVPSTVENFLLGISELHYIDVGLNCPGAYVTDRNVVERLANHLLDAEGNMLVVIHGTPRQWSDDNRPWIREEKDRMLQLLQDGVLASGGRLGVAEKWYFQGMMPNLQMHFEIIDVMEI